MGDAKMVLRFPVRGGDFAAAGEASSRIKKLLRQVGEDAEVTRRICVAAYEAEMNIVIHAHHGEMILQMEEEEVTVIATDAGPGIPDVELAMQEGFSTASDYAREMGFGAGMGLSNMKRCADHMRIDTEVGKGTRVTLEFKSR